jgi:Dicarboxylate transport
VIAIDGLSLPIGTSKGGTRSFAAESVTIDIPTESDAETLAVAQLIDRLLSLPITLADTELIVAEMNIATYPTVRDIRWSSTGIQQQLTANLDAVHLAVQVITTDEDSFKTTFSLQHSSFKAPGQSITTNIRRTEAGVSISGASILELPITAMIATSIATSLGSTLAGIEFADGTAILELDAELPFDENQPASATAYLKPATPFEFAYSVDVGVVNVVSVRSASPIKIEATYPDSQWSINEEQVSLSMSYQDRNDVKATVGNLACTNGPSCYMNLDVSMDDVDLTIATASRLELAAVQDFTFGEDGIQVLIRPDAELALTGMSVSGTEIASLNAVLMSAASLDLMESGWTFTTGSLEGNVESLSLTDNMKFSAPVLLHDLSVNDVDQNVSINSRIDSAFSQLTWDERTIAFPGFSGKVALQDDIFVTELTTIGLLNEGIILAEHSIRSDTGRMSVTGASLSFGAQNLSGLVAPWTDDWDVTAGIFSADLHMKWQQSDSGWQLDGESSFDFTDLAGAYSGTAFAGLSTKLVSDFNTTSGITVSPAQIQIDLLEVGLPIENITAYFTLRTDTLSVDVASLQMHAFGGVVNADPFTFELESERNTLLLHAESIELTELLTLKEFESIDLTGSIGAELPVIIEGKEVSILDGKLTGVAPGGVIRYQPDIVPDTEGTSAIGIVTDALSNFEYDTLTSTVGYSKDGDLVLQMQIAGRNPDREDNRPVVLNLGVESNIPQMLKSLQAARAVEEILEKRIEK